jgi:hypothetical protein
VNNQLITLYTNRRRITSPFLPDGQRKSPSKKARRFDAPLTIDTKFAIFPYFPPRLLDPDAHDALRRAKTGPPAYSADGP